MEAVRQLTQLGRAAVPPLVDALGYTNVDTRVRAASVLGELGSRAVEAVPALTHALEDPSALVRRVAALALGKITPTTPAAVARLIQALGDPDPNVPDNAAWALRALGPAAASRLINALQVTDVKVRRGVAQVLVTGLAIRRSDFAGPQTITALTAALHDADADVRSEATRGLAEIGPPASGALPLLRKLASDDPVVDVRRLATRAVGRIQRP
jgi:HEAT repeat protein